MSILERFLIGGALVVCAILLAPVCLIIIDGTQSVYESYSIRRTYPMGTLVKLKDSDIEGYVIRPNPTFGYVSVKIRDDNSSEEEQWYLFEIEKVK